MSDPSKYKEVSKELSKEFYSKYMDSDKTIQFFFSVDAPGTPASNYYVWYTSGIFLYVFRRFGKKTITTCTREEIMRSYPPSISLVPVSVEFELKHMEDNAKLNYLKIKSVQKDYYKK